MSDERVPKGRELPPRSLILGIPAKQVGEVDDKQAADIERAAARCASLGD